MSNLTIKCITLDEPKGSSYIKSSDRLKCKNATVNPKNNDDRKYLFYVDATS